jgi:hypothetical protein
MVTFGGAPFAILPAESVEGPGEMEGTAGALDLLGAGASRPGDGGRGRDALGYPRTPGGRRTRSRGGRPGPAGAHPDADPSPPVEGPREKADLGSSRASRVLTRP